MQRRDFITLLGGAAAIWPMVARAQQDGRVRRIGFLATGARDDAGGPSQRRLGAFRRGLANNLGWIEGRNLVIDERWPGTNPEHLRAAAAEIAGLRPDVIFVSNSSALAAIRRTTGTIPIVFAVVADPVGQGFVSSLAQPGGNITGFAAYEFALATKVLELLKKMAPGVTRVAVVYDPVQPSSTGTLAELEAVAASLGVQLSKASVRNANEIERAIDALAREPNGGLYVQASPATALHRELVVALAARHRLPAVYSLRYFAASGGLASYGVDDADLSRLAASYVDRILKGEKPADLPVQLPTKFEFVINLKTAKAMGLVLSPEVLALADEVIE
jgi:putative ABC transport system substrate-binding protein